MRLVLIILINFSILQGFSQERSNKLIKASIKLIGSYDAESYELLSKNLKEFKTAHIRSSILTIMGLSSMRSGDESYNNFNSMYKKYYSFEDISGIDQWKGNYDAGIQKHTVNLIFNIAGSETLSPASLNLRPRTSATEEFLGEKVAKPIAKKLKKNPNLEHAELEFRNYLNAQQRRSKMSIFDKCEAIFENRVPVMVLDLSQDFLNKEKGYKEQVSDGLFRFWKLRVRQNGLGKEAALKMKNQNEVIKVLK